MVTARESVKHAVLVTRQHSRLILRRRIRAADTISRYFVADSSITVVTHDYSLFENPATVDYFTRE
ncbi:MAG: hypothetical protein WBC78_07915 [Candidatus Sulfotelmatobacter sp.]